MGVPPAASESRVAVITAAQAVARLAQAERPTRQKLTVHLEHVHVEVRQVELTLTPTQECAHVFPTPNAWVCGCNRKETRHYTIGS